MDEFSLINVFFKSKAISRDDVIIGIGDDAACLHVAENHDLLVSTDTLVSGVHFLPEDDPWDIAWKAVMVNVSDMAAMAAVPCWVSLALTLPSLDKNWLERFSAGLHSALKKYNIALVGGDTTKGPLAITLTIHGQVPAGSAVKRSTACCGDTIWVSGLLGAAAQAVAFLGNASIDKDDFETLLDKLYHPIPRIDLLPLLRDYASAAIDISDGLSADLNHICETSGLGATLFLEKIPVHPLVHKFQQAKAAHFALSGGDDYELCFTVAPARLQAFKQALIQSNIECYQIGEMDTVEGMRLIDGKGVISLLTVKGYNHFRE